jgi:hypothetical protein
MARIAHPNDRKYKIEALWDRHHEMVRLILLGRGNKEIAERLSVTPQNVSDVRNSPIVRDRLSVLQAARDASTVDIARIIQEEAPGCIALLKDVRAGREEANIGLRVQVAQDLLDRAGHGAIRKTQAEIVSAHLTREDIEAIKQRARSLRETEVVG